MPRAKRAGRRRSLRRFRGQWKTPWRGGTSRTPRCSRRRRLQRGVENESETLAVETQTPRQVPSAAGQRPHQLVAAWRRAPQPRWGTSGRPDSDGQESFDHAAVITTSWSTASATSFQETQWAREEAKRLQELITIIHAESDYTSSDWDLERGVEAFSDLMGGPNDLAPARTEEVNTFTRKEALWEDHFFPVLKLAEVGPLRPEVLQYPRRLPDVGGARRCLHYNGLPGRDQEESGWLRHQLTRDNLAGTKSSGRWGQRKGSWAGAQSSSS